ncbi:hypothetical protein ABT085_41540, partial [Streptomyces sp. NPDC002265]
METEDPYERSGGAPRADSRRARVGDLLRPGTWWAHVRDAMGPEGEPAPLTRRAVRLDVVLALVLTVVALVVATRYPGDGPVRISSRAVVEGRAVLPSPPAVPGPGYRPEAGFASEPAAPPWGLV